MIGRFLNQIAEPATSRWILLALLVVLIIFPWAAGEAGNYYTVLLMVVFIFATLGHAWNLLAGFCGLLSFGIQVYIGLGGFTVAILKYYLNVPVWWAMLLSIVVTTAVAWLMAAPLSGRHARRNVWIGVIVAIILWIIYETVIAFNPGADLFGGAYIRRVIILFGIFLGALPLLKLQGAYFAVATWLIAAAFASIFNEWRVVGAGGGMNIANETTIIGRYYAGLLLVVVATGVVWWLLNSRYGQALTAVRDDEEAASAIGVDVRLVKTLVFLISAPMAGLAAALYYIDAVTITPPDAFHIRWSAYAVFIVVAGGMGTLAGPVIGAVVFIIVQRFLVGFWGGGDLTLGIAAVLLILLLPRGIAGLLNDLREKAGNAPPKKQFSLANKFEAAKGAVVALGLAPSSPAIPILKGTNQWRDLQASMASLAQSITAARPDTLVILSKEPGAAFDGRSVGRLTGSLRDPAYANLGDVDFDVQFDHQLAQNLSEAGLRVHYPSNADEMRDVGAASVLSQLNPDSRLPVVIVDMSASQAQDAAQVGRAISEVSVQLGRRVAIIGASGLSGSSLKPDTQNQPEHLFREDDDQINRQVLGALQSGDVQALGQTLSKAGNSAHFEVNGAILVALAELAHGSAKSINYGAIFGAGFAVVEFQPKGNP